MGKICAKSSLAKINAEDQAVLDCKVTRDKIKAYIRKLEKNANLKKDKAKEALKAKNKDKARILLRQAKMYTEQSKSADKQLEMIEDQITNIETAQNQRDAINVLKQGNDVLKQLNKEVNVEKLEEIAEDMNEAKAQQDEIAEFFKSKGLNPEEEEDAINNELDKLMQSEGYAIDKELPDARSEKVEMKESEMKIAIEA